MSQHTAPRLNAARRRARKRFLARRDGRHCTYCRVPFTADLRNATMDHVVPLSLFRTWSAVHLVLACRPCNTAKGNRLPLSIALLLTASIESDTPTDRPAPAPDWPLLARLAHARQSADRSADRLAERSGCDLPESTGRAAGRGGTSRVGPPRSGRVDRSADRLRSVPDPSAVRQTTGGPPIALPGRQVDLPYPDAAQPERGNVA
ncbi:HNH endonuclease [Streptomyces celluloflavus]|uniref:HNH endonuclease n=1 Tax=Streptomyces celluloflavus TaxID=58344 RepID=UPI0036C568F4